MAAQQAQPAFSYQIEIGGTTFGLFFAWNTRFKYWTVSIYDAAGNPIATGRKLSLDSPLLEFLPQENLPQQLLIAADLTGKIARIARDDLGVTVFPYAI